MGIHHILIRLFAPLINIIVDCLNMIIRRDRHIILCGSWMGEKFADNTRYLFGYLNANPEKYNLKKIVWVTRNRSVYEQLTDCGYQVYMMHSAKSLYYHLKAGVHIVCNLGFPVKGYRGDIMGQMSGRAIKVNTWHGIPIKAGKSTGENAKSGNVLSKMRYHFKNSRILTNVFSPGHWDQSYYLSTGKECTRRCSVFCGVSEENFIECGYPRDCKFDLMTDHETQIVEQINNNKTAILYVPTFRSDGSMPHPLDNEEFKKYITDNNILWIEKPHFATRERTNTTNRDNVIFLDSSFDINVIIPYLFLVITDYSSVYYDAMAFDRPVIFYSPDYENYAKYDRGFLCDYKSIAGQYNATDISGLAMLISRMIDDTDYYNKVIDKIAYEKKEMFDRQQWSIEKICSCLFCRLGLN